MVCTLWSVAVIVKTPKYCFWLLA